MPKGLTNTPAGFQRFMNDIFANMIDVFVVIYLDDILVYSNDPKQHSGQRCNRMLMAGLCELEKLYQKKQSCLFTTIMLMNTRNVDLGR